jgi:serine phosphatase RsbU (regulator of sigma subunit)
VETKVKLEKGDLLVLYTDGVTEARNSSGQQYGLEQLSKVIAEARSESVELIRDKVFEHHAKWMQTQDDDVTLMILRQVGRAERAVA